MHSTCMYCVFFYLVFTKMKLMAFPPLSRSQKTNHLQKDSGLHAALSGLSMAGLSSGQVFGFSVNPRTIEKFKQELASSHVGFIKDQLSEASNVRFSKTTNKRNLLYYKNYN